MAVTQEVIITKEAVFDYEHCLEIRERPTNDQLMAEAGGDYLKFWDITEKYENPTRTLDKARLRKDLKEYITHMVDSNRLLREHYFRVKWFDGNTDLMLMLFVYRDRLDASKQYWRLAGICKAEDWSQELEDDGIIRKWLKPFELDEPKGDWVAEQQARAEVDRQFDYRVVTLNGLPKEVLNAIINGTDKDLTQAISCFQNASKEQFGS